ncbi:MAG TPA: methyltransferase domain-containing protein [Mycobacteriales bacterium]|nr:methyltransferase domain-containing protein [Mycobacteriales bacterium]
MADGVSPLQLRWRLWVAGPRRLQQRVRRVLYAGSSVECPCCGTKARRFLADYNRRDARCRACFSQERHRGLRLFLDGWLPTLDRPAFILHQAADPALAEWLRKQPGVRHVSGDLGERPADLRYDLQRMPLHDETVDVLIASHVLEHIPDDRVAMAEIRRVLKPGGSAVLLVPIDGSRSATYENPAVSTPEQRAAEYWQFDHVRLYGRDFAERLASAGFEVTVHQPSRDLPTDAARRFGLLVDPEVYERHPISPPDEIYLATRPR